MNRFEEKAENYFVCAIISLSIIGPGMLISKDHFKPENKHQQKEK